MTYCTRCHHYLSKPAATVTSGGGSAHYGPVCAQILGLLPARIGKRRTTMPRERRARRDDRQMDLLEVMNG